MMSCRNIMMSPRGWTKVVTMQGVNLGITSFLSLLSTLTGNVILTIFNINIPKPYFLTILILILIKIILLPIDVLKICLLSGKQCRPWSDQYSVVFDLSLHYGYLFRHVHPNTLVTRSVNKQCLLDTPCKLQGNDCLLKNYLTRSKMKWTDMWMDTVMKTVYHSLHKHSLLGVQILPVYRFISRMSGDGVI